MDLLVVGNDFASAVLTNIALTRRPNIEITSTPPRVATGLQPPFILTNKGAIFGFAALTDFLLNRHPFPALTDVDAVRRGLEMTVFYALVDREHKKLQLASPHEAAQWISSLIPMLQQNKFYTGDRLTVCDCALVALLEYARLNHALTTPHGAAYANRFADELASILKRNLEHAE